MAGHAPRAGVPVRHRAPGRARALGFRHVDGLRPCELRGRAPSAVHGAAGPRRDRCRCASLQR
eukprot:7089441-Alexandrium_andersonii.AAC.1